MAISIEGASNPQEPTPEELIRARRLAQVGNVVGGALELEFETLRGPSLSQKEVLAIARILEEQDMVISAINVCMANGGGLRATYAVSDSKAEELFAKADHGNPLD